MTVYLVGAGPGDPGLLTRRGAEVLAGADAVLYDRLAEARILELAPPRAERIDVGQRLGRGVDQEGINRLLVDLGRSRSSVVRLKGGDPFVLGRGGEEAAALAAAGVAFEVVPGVTSAVAVPAYAGVPLTQRGLSASFTVVSGSSGDDPDPEPDWDALARVGGTIVLLMGVARRNAIAARLMEAGLAPDTPVAAVERGTRPEQRTVRTTLAGLGGVELSSPAVMVIGAVAALDLEWQGARRLAGRRVLLTRSAERAGPMAGALARAGAEVVEVPLTATVPAGDGGEALGLVARRLATFDWVVFSSANAVAHLFAQVKDARAFGAARVAAVGPGTAAALADRGVEADLVSPKASGAGLAEAMPASSSLGTVLLPRSEQAGRQLPDSLAAKGWVVVEAPAYRTVPLTVGDEEAAAAGACDAVVFAAGSAVRAYLAAGLPVPAAVVALGPTTARAATEAGLAVTAVAAGTGPQDVVDAVSAALNGPGPGPRP